MHSFCSDPTHQFSKLLLRHRAASISVHKVEYFRQNRESVWRLESSRWAKASKQLNIRLFGMHHAGFLIAMIPVFVDNSAER